MTRLVDRPLKVLHVHDRWSALGGADWHLVSILDSFPAEIKAFGLFGRDDGSVPKGMAASCE